MALRIKSHWNLEEAQRALPEIASALAFIAWRLALDKAIQLHCARFLYRDDAQRLSVIQEYLIFLVQIADRLAAERMDQEARRILITSLVKQLIAHWQENAEELLGPGDHGRRFVEQLDERSEEYADFRMTEEGPSYPFLRHLGFSIQTWMGEAGENRWVIDQVMDKDGYEAYRDFASAFDNLFD